MLISMWYLVILKFWFALASGLFYSIPVTQLLPFIIDESSNWVLFLLLMPRCSMSSTNAYEVSPQASVPAVNETSRSMGLSQTVV